MFSIIFLLTACSTEESSTLGNADIEKPKKEEISLVDQISEKFLQDKITDGSDLFDRESMPEYEYKILFVYYHLFNYLKTEKDISMKLSKIETQIEKFKTYLGEYESDNEDMYFNRFIDEKVNPLIEYYNSKTVKIGMNTLELIVSMGYPNKINRTTTASSVSQQWVYRDIDVYVYLENGVVTSFQD
jgi:hypothetical protein